MFLKNQNLIFQVILQIMKIKIYLLVKGDTLVVNDSGVIKNFFVNKSTNSLRWNKYFFRHKVDLDIITKIIPK